MLRDRYEPMDLFALVPALSLAMELVLAQLDRLLEDDRLFQHVKADVRRRAPHTATRGRSSTPVEVILRMNEDVVLKPVERGQNGLQGQA
jgi:IS5 family transposase